MAITFPAAHLAKTKLLNVSEDWLLQLYYGDESSFIGLSHKNRIVSSVQYYGLVMDFGEIEQSLYLEESRASIASVDINIINKWKTDTLAAELYGGTNKYLNRKVKIYSCLNDESTLSNCALLFEGILIAIQHNQEMVTLLIEQRSPWMDITIPQTKSSGRGALQPVAYGNYTENTNNEFPTNVSLYPCPYQRRFSNKLWYILTQAESGSEGELHYYDTGLNVFHKITSADANTTSANNVNQAGVPVSLERSFHFRPAGANTGDEFTNTANAYDGNTGTSATNTYQVTDGGLHEFQLRLDIPESDLGEYIKFEVHAYVGVNLSAFTTTQPGYTGSITAKVFGNVHGEDIASPTVVDRDTSEGTGTDSDTDFSVDLLYVDSGSLLNEALDATETGIDVDLGTDFDGGQFILVDSEIMYIETITANTLTVIRGAMQTTPATHLDNAPVYVRRSTFETPSYVGVLGQWVMSADDTLTATVSVVEVWIEATMVVDPGVSGINAGATNKTIRDIKYLFTGADGLPESFTNGSGSAATLPHEIHRDLLDRFSDLDYANAQMNGYTDLDTARSGWVMRFWQLEEIRLSDVLKKIQYEGCFIFLLTGDSDGSGNPGGRYVWVKNTYSSGDVTQTLSDEDYEMIDISMTDIKELITKTLYNYRRHPSTEKYLATETYTNATARTDWNVSTLENVVTQNLDYLNGSTNGTEDIYDSGSGDSDPNESICLYYDNILANPRIIVDCEMVNVAKSNIELGDIIQFNDSQIDPFGKTWTDLYFMVVEIRRSMGRIYLKSREVYEA